MPQKENSEVLRLGSAWRPLFRSVRTRSTRNAVAKSAGRAATAFHLLVGFRTIRHNFDVQQNVSGDSYHMGGHDYGGFRRRDLYERLRRVPVGHAGHIEDASQRAMDLRFCRSISYRRHSVGLGSLHNGTGPMH